jgi:uncharacterized membrane protein YoaK (UPF0700 family)
MTRSPRGPEGPDPVFSALDGALLELLREAPDERAAMRARRLRVLGSAALLLAAVCMAAMALPSLGISPAAAGLLFVSAVLLLFCGGWAMDKATVTELRAHRQGFVNPLTGILNDADLGLTQASIRRRGHFGLALLLLSGFCVCVAWAPIPGKQPLDATMWSAFAVTLVTIGTWQLHRALKEARVSGAMSSAAQHRHAARAGKHLGRIK